MIVSAAPSMRCSPLIPGLQSQAETRIIDTQIPVRAAPNRLRHDLGNLLRHDPNIGRVAPEVPIAIEIDAAVEFSHLRDVTLQANVGSLAAAAAAAALRELYATPERSSIFIVENIKCRQADVRDFFLVESNFVAQFGVLRLDIRCGAALAADTPPASDNDNPAAPKAGASLRFEGSFRCDMYQSPSTSRFPL